MKIVVIVYLVCWLILLFVKLQDYYQKKYHPSEYDRLSKYFEKKDPWYLYVAIIVFAPLSVLSIPYSSIRSYLWRKKHTHKEIPVERARKMRNKANLTRYYLVNVYEVLRQFFDEKGIRYIVDESDGTMYFMFYNKLVVLRKSAHNFMLYLERMFRVEIEAGKELEAHRIINDYNCTSSVIKVYLSENYLVFSYELFVHGIVLHDDMFYNKIMDFLISYSDNFFDKEEVCKLFHFSWGKQYIELEKIDFSQYPKSRKEI